MDIVRLQGPTRSRSRALFVAEVVDTENDQRDPLNQSSGKTSFYFNTQWARCLSAKGIQQCFLRISGSQRLVCEFASRWLKRVGAARVHEQRFGRKNKSWPALDDGEHAPYLSAR
jgi:hypothetical protein